MCFISIKISDDKFSRKTKDGARAPSFRLPTQLSSKPLRKLSSRLLSISSKGRVVVHVLSYRMIIATIDIFPHTC